MAAEQVACYFCIINLFILINFQIKNNCYHNPGQLASLASWCCLELGLLLARKIHSNRSIKYYHIWQFNSQIHDFCISTNPSTNKTNKIIITGRQRIHQYIKNQRINIKLTLNSMDRNLETCPEKN